MVQKRKSLFGALMLVCALVLGFGLGACKKDKDEKAPVVSGATGGDEALKPGSYAIVKAGREEKLTEYDEKNPVYQYMRGGLYTPCLEAVELGENGVVTFPRYDFGSLKFTHEKSGSGVIIRIDPATKGALESPNADMVENAGALALLMEGWEVTPKGEELEFGFTFGDLQEKIQKGKDKLSNAELKAKTDETIRLLDLAKKSLNARFIFAYKKDAKAPEKPEKKPIVPPDTKLHYKLTKGGLKKSIGEYKKGGTMIYDMRETIGIPCADHIFLCEGDKVLFGHYDFGELKFKYETEGNTIKIKVDEATKGALSNPNVAMKANAGFIAICMQKDGYWMYGDEQKREHTFSLTSLREALENGLMEMDNAEMKEKINLALGQVKAGEGRMGKSEFILIHEKQ